MLQLVSTEQQSLAVNDGERALFFHFFKFSQDLESLTVKTVSLQSGFKPLIKIRNRQCSANSLFNCCAQI